MTNEKFRLGVLKMKRGDHSEAWACFAEARRQEPRNLEVAAWAAWTDYIHADCDPGIRARSRTIIEQALRADPNLEAVRGFLGRLAFEDGRATDALPLLERASRADPQNLELRSWLHDARQVAPRSLFRRVSDWFAATDSEVPRARAS